MYEEAIKSRLRTAFCKYSKLIKCFEDTIEFSKSKKLIEKTNKAIASNKIYFENSSCNPQRVKSGLFDRNIIVEQNTTFNAAKKYTHLGRVAVLNFANPVNPGGGVQNGAMAQEECLCRSSNLYLCLCADNVRDDYYSYHSKKGNQFWSDRLIYTRDVTVFKDDKDIPKLLPKKEWFDVDVITCAAPYLAKRKYTRWIEFNNKYFGKQVSILGDSISTLDGYNPRGYNVFYKENNCEKSAVREISDTWWGKVIDFFGGELLVNNSWSGSRVTKLPIKDSLFPSGCSDERTSALHINNVKPDVIIVYLGTNDWANGIPTLEYWENSGDYENWLGTMLLPNEECFDVAYEQMLTKLKANYPNAEIWCCTLCETHISKRPDFQFPHKYSQSKSRLLKKLPMMTPIKMHR